MMCTFFRRLARSRKERQQMPKTLKTLTYKGINKTKKVVVLIRILGKAICPQTFIEIGAWLLVVTRLGIRSL